MLTRALKELRVLMPPAGLIVGAAILAMVGGHSHTRAIFGLAVRVLLLSFFVGMAMLAATSFGSEFQQRTLVLLLSQPIARTRVWFEKWAALVSVACAVVAFQYAVVRLGPLAIGEQPMGPELLYLIAILCSAPLWTLVARSTIGGLAFSMAALFLLMLAQGFALSQLQGRPIDPFAATPPTIAIQLAYAAVTFWLGWRMFTRFQVTDAAYGDQSSSVGGATWSVLRARPAGAIRNLVCKELLLHRPTILVAALFSGCWLIAVAFFGLQPLMPPRPRIALNVFFFLLMFYVPLAIMLAGAVGVGEEATVGVRQWHMTLPVSARVQWGVKLAVSLLLGAVLVIALPSALATIAWAAPDMQRDIFDAVSQPRVWVTVGLAIVLSFWAATLVGHTIRAAVAVGLFLPALVATGWIAFWGSEVLGRFAGNLWTAVMVRFQLPPDYPYLYPYLRTMPTTIAVTIAAVGTGLALHQSFVAFRGVQTDARTIRRYAGQLLGAMGLIALCWGTFLFAWTRQFVSPPVKEVRAAVQAVLQAEPDRPRRYERSIALSELDATGALSPRTKRWLSNTRIVATRGGGDSKGQRYYFLSISFPHERRYRDLVHTVPDTHQ
ncbi:MAG: hypothetical protein A3H96_08220 [Acidobacteria bacterium RIFCSPLOWO2_02_FULL_67_36]|nr:MAG: hypothetical protein A3H96_08220 [Acidobacteria bacterium RIFCSPLOWO2_02_FULL_67_36]